MLYKDDLANSHNHTNSDCSWWLTEMVPKLSVQGKWKKVTAIKHITQEGDCFLSKISWIFYSNADGTQLLCSECPRCSTSLVRKTGIHGPARLYPKENFQALTLPLLVWSGKGRAETRPSVEFMSPGKEFNSTNLQNFRSSSLNQGSHRLGTLSCHEQSREKQILNLSFSPFILITIF